MKTQNNGNGVWLPVAPTMGDWYRGGYSAPPNQPDLFAAHIQEGRSIIPRKANGDAIPKPLTPAQKAKKEAEIGIARAMESAENACPKWGDLAYAFLLSFVKTHALFISEDVSFASIEWGMVQPPTLKSWGAVYRRAVKSGVIEQCGSGKSVRRHGSICPKWRSL